MAQLRAVSTANPVTTMVLDELYQAAPVLNDIEFYMQGGNAPTIKKGREPGSGEVGFRNLNEDQAATGPTRNDVPQTKRILGYESKVDRVLEQRNEDPAAELEQDTRLKAEEAGYIFQEKFFEGDNATNAKEFDGLRALIAAGKTIDYGGAALPLELGGDAKRLGQQVFMEQILRFISLIPGGGATHLYMNDDLLNRFVIVAKALGYYRETLDDLGMVVQMIRNTIIRSASRKYDGTPLLPFTETLGGDNDCSSIFAVRHAERRHLTAVTSAGVYGDYEGLRGKFYVNTVDLDMTLVLQHDAAVWRYQGIRMPAA